jgi:hypothetical protein
MLNNVNAMNPLGILQNAETHDDCPAISSTNKAKRG